MIEPLDNLIRDHLLNEVATLATNPQQVRFQPPDGDLKAEVVNLAAMVLSVYLVDVREHRSLRSNERTARRNNGDVYFTRVPDRLECHYLLSAWSPVQPGPAVEPQLDEHALLYDVARALFRGTPLNPSRVYPAGAPELALWGDFGEEDLPTRVAPPEGYPGMGDFWSAMGSDARWRPLLYLAVTVPIALVERLGGPVVTTRFVDYRISDTPGSTEVLVQIGGSVIHESAPGGETPLAGVAVNLETTLGHVLATERTDEDGRFTFERLQSDQYVLRTRGIGLPVLTRTIDVPASTGEYDLRYP